MGLAPGHPLSRVECELQWLPKLPERPELHELAAHRSVPAPNPIPQLAVLPESHLGFAERPILVAHQAQHGQQLRLGELVFAERSALGRQNRGSHLQRNACERQETDFGHFPSCLAENHIAAASSKQTSP